MFDDSIVVVPWDFSTLAQSALELALGKSPPNRIRVICVLERPDAYTLNWGEEKENRAKQKCEEQFWHSIDVALDSGLEFTTLFGEAAPEIVDFADRVNAGLILMSTHGRTGIAEVVMGSVAKRVMQSANCPVLLLPSAWCKANGINPPIDARKSAPAN